MAGGEAGVAAQSAGPQGVILLMDSYGVVMRVQASPDAAEFVRAHGGTLWVWAARPRICCSGTAYMRAATAAPPGRSGFTLLPADGLELWFRAPAGGLLPDVLEIGLKGRRHPRVEAYWDGCLFALGS